MKRRMLSMLAVMVSSVCDGAFHTCMAGAGRLAQQRLAEDHSDYLGRNLVRMILTLAPTSANGKQLNEWIGDEAKIPPPDQSMEDGGNASAEYLSKVAGNLMQAGSARKGLVGLLFSTIVRRLNPSKWQALVAIIEAEKEKRQVNFTALLKAANTPDRVRKLRTRGRIGPAQDRQLVEAWHPLVRPERKKKRARKKMPTAPAGGWSYSKMSLPATGTLGADGMTVAVFDRQVNSEHNTVTLESGAEKKRRKKK